MLLENIDVNLDVKLITEAECKEDLTWGKSLEFLPVFTRREINLHVGKCGKRKNLTIKKTLERGLKFKEERYISSESLFTARTLKNFIAKATCRASMKKMYRQVEIYINRRSSVVDKARCNCPAGLSGYCNHIMALLLELAEYSLNSLKVVPTEKVCTSVLRKWGVPGNKETVKYPVMKTVLHANVMKKGIAPTIYEARLNYNAIKNVKSIKKLQDELRALNTNIGYAYIIPNNLNLDSEVTKFGVQFVGSPLSYQLLPVKRDFIVLGKLPEQIHTSTLSILPIRFLDIPDSSQKEMEFLEKIKLSPDESIKLQAQTIKQRECPQWFKERKYRITSSNAHKIYIRKKNFETLVKQVTQNIRKLPANVNEMFNHGVINEDVAKEKFVCVMNYRLRENVKIEETDLLVQPCLPWLGASPDGLVFTKSGIHLMEVKCPYTKRNTNPNCLVNDKTFYIGTLPTGELFLKKDHAFGYYTQVQLAWVYLD